MLSTFWMILMHCYISNALYSPKVTEMLVNLTGIQYCLKSWCILLMETYVCLLLEIYCKLGNFHFWLILDSSQTSKIKRHHCGAEVDSLGTHGLSCRHIEGRFHRHAYINGIIHRALTSAKIPSQLEPICPLRYDGKQPDSMTLVPWKCGQLLVWDATCPDSFALWHRPLATSAAGKESR